MIHEPSIKSMRPTKNPKSAGLKSMATPKIRQIIQNVSIADMDEKYLISLRISIEKFSLETRKIPDYPGLKRDISIKTMTIHRKALGILSRQ